MKTPIYLLVAVIRFTASCGDSNNKVLVEGTDPAWNLCNGLGKLAGCGQDQLGLLWGVIQACAKMEECSDGATACTEPTSPERHAAFAALWDMNAALRVPPSRVFLKVNPSSSGLLKITSRPKTVGSASSSACPAPRERRSLSGPPVNTTARAFAVMEAVTMPVAMAPSSQ